MDHSILVEALDKSFMVPQRSGKGMLPGLWGFIRRPMYKLDVLTLLDLKVRKGEIYGLLGPNAAGKTTLLRILSTSILPDGGRVLVNSHDVTDPAKKSEISSSLGVILGDRSRSFYLRLSPRQNLEFFSELYHIDPKESGERIDYLLDFVGLSGRAEDNIMRFSTGMLNRLSIARAFLHSPDILLLDEFMVNLDPKASVEIRRIVRDLAKKEGKTVLFTSHQSYDAENLADRLGILHKGKIRAEGTPRELKNQYAVEGATVRISLDDPSTASTFASSIGSTQGVSKVAIEKDHISILANEPGYVLENAVRMADRNNIRLRNIEVLPPSIETVFMKVTSGDPNDTE